MDYTKTMYELFDNFNLSPLYHIHASTSTYMYLCIYIYIHTLLYQSKIKLKAQGPKFSLVNTFFACSMGPCRSRVSEALNLPRF